jgi:hypothetical protein
MIYVFVCDNPRCAEHGVDIEIDLPINDRNKVITCLSCDEKLRRKLVPTRPNESWSKWSRKP